MDYCHHCQRHLNGALACAGCGTPAEELRLHDPVPHEAEVVLATREYDREPALGPRRQRGSRKRKVSRRERREMRAERGTHRRKGRAVLLTVMGLVLAVGALSLAELALESGGDGDSTSVQEDRAIELDGGPPPADPKQPKDPGPVEGTPSGSTDSARPGGNGSPDPSATGEGTGTGSGSSDEESPAPTESAGPSESPNPSDSPDPTDSTGPSGGPSTPGRPNQPPPPAPEPTPTPTPTKEECVLVIFCF
ncbi:SCO2400 family protein [Streptomyces niveus]|uniref:SCO2400 family protein n=1 Tax=Streptomyces niveus TaxID=193462 RepID=UPI0033A11141